MPTVVLKLFARQSGDYVLPPFGEHTNGN